MDFNTCLKTRRSMRRYEKRAVSRETLLELIGAAQLAPSWKNSQVSRYYIAEGAAKDTLMACLPAFNQASAKDAAALIVTAVVKGVSGYREDGAPATHLGAGFQCFDNGLQAENLCLKAQELGLGTLIMGLYDEPGIRSFFGIDSAQEIVCVIAVGVPAAAPAMPPRLPLTEVAFFKD